MATTNIDAGTALVGPHGEVAEYLGTADYCDSPGIVIRRMSGRRVVPASHLGTEWVPVPGRVRGHEHPTGGWNSPGVRRLIIITD